LAQLVSSNPFLVKQPWVYRKPFTMLCVLHRTEAKAMEHFLAHTPQELVEGLMPELLYSIDRQTIVEGLPPIINMVSCHNALISVLKNVDFKVVAEVIRVVPAQHILVAMRSPPRALEAVIAAVDPKLLEDIIVEMLTESPRVLEDSFVPLLTHTRHLARVAMLANHVKIELLLCVLRGVSGKQLAAFVDAMADEDFSNVGSVTRLMRLVESDFDFVVSKLVPLFARGEAEKMAHLVHHTEPRHLLEVLRHVEVEGVLCLLANTNETLVIQILRLPLEQSISSISEIAGTLATAMQRHPSLAATISHQSDQLVRTMKSCKDAKERLRNGIRTSVDRGKLSRGATSEAAYSFGDLTRGVVSKHLRPWRRSLRISPMPSNESESPTAMS